jgi:TolB-like protein
VTIPLSQRFAKKPMLILRPTHLSTQSARRLPGRGWVQVLIASVLCLGLGCQKAARPSGADAFIPQEIKRVLVLPFENMTKIYGENASIRSPLSGKIFFTGAVKKGSPEFLSEKLISFLDQKGEFHLIPPEQAEGLALDPTAMASTDDAERHLVQQMGQQLSADAVLVGRLYRYKERVGTKYAADSPASVAFDLNLVSVADGRLLWSGSFDETQQALNENLFLLGSFLKRKGTWITADEMAVTGLANLIEKLPGHPGQGK